MNNIISYCLNKLFGFSPDLTQSRLYDDDSFYPKFKKDLSQCREEVIIESPFISAKRMHTLSYLFENLVNKKVKVYIVTRDPEEHSANMKQQAEEAIRNFERMGVQVIISDYNHRKLAILDRQILWGVLTSFLKPIVRKLCVGLVVKPRLKSVSNFSTCADIFTSKNLICFFKFLYRL